MPIKYDEPGYWNREPGSFFAKIKLASRSENRYTE